MAVYRHKPLTVEAFRFGIDKPPRWWKHAVSYIARHRHRAIPFGLTVISMAAALLLTATGAWQ